MKRRYTAPARAQMAAATKVAVLEAGRSLFAQKGYVATSVAEIAKMAGVNTDTVYATVGRKPQLLRALIESAISGTMEAVPAAQRDYVAEIRASPDAATKLGVYAAAVGKIQPRLAPMFVALSEAARTDKECASLWAEISARRAHNMREFAADLRATGAMRDDLSDAEIADIIWSLNGPEHYQMLVGERSWTPARFAAWLCDAWCRLLLA